MRDFGKFQQEKLDRLAESTKPKELKDIEAKINEAKKNDIDSLEALFVEKTKILASIEEAKANSKEDQDKKKPGYSLDKVTDGKKGGETKEKRGEGYSLDKVTDGKKGGETKEKRGEGYSKKYEEFTSALSESLKCGDLLPETLDVMESVMLNEDYGVKYSIDDALSMVASLKKITLPHSNMFKSMKKHIGDSAGTKLNDMFNSIKTIEEDLEDLAISWGEKYTEN